MHLSILVCSLFGTLSASQSVSESYCPPKDVSEAQQRDIFHEFVEKFLVEKNATKALLDHMDEDYIQHNPNALSGRDVAIQLLGGGVGISRMEYTVMGEGFGGNKGFVHYKMQPPSGLPYAIVDIFRMNGSCIMEHWDVVQRATENMKNPLALF